MTHFTRTATPLRQLAAVAALAAVLLAGVAAAQGPPASGRGVSSAGPLGPLQVHAVSGTDSRWVAGKLRDIYAARADVRIDGTATGHLVVSAPPETQQEIVRWLAANGLAPASESATPVAPSQPPKEPQPIVTQAFHLSVLDARAFEEKVTKTWGTAVQASHDSVGDVATFRFAATPAGPTSLVVDRRANTATVAAPASSAKSWQRVISMLDSKPKSADERTKIQPIVHADRTTVQRAVAMLQELLADANKHRKQHIGQFVSMLFQPATGAQPPIPPRPAVPGVPGALPPGAAPTIGEQSSAVMPSQGATAADIEAIARINNVRIEILEDVVVISGRREDVERVARIIEQIEQQSVQFRPDVEIYHLKHVDSTALTDMINQVYATAFARQGLVTVVPLQRPNAVMLIGRKENIPAIVELIAKLDQPAPTDGQFKIFNLKFMSAIDAERTIRNFFVTRPPTVTDLRPGLGTRALVIADYRTNSLLVQAAPRDMLEIIKLLEQLDIPESQVTYEVRTFKLRNSIAETLAPVLEEAITAAAASVTAQTVTGAAGQATPARATPPAVNLQFQRLGPAGVELMRSGIMANVRIIADARSNTLLVVGPPAAMDLMAALIEQLDRLPATEAQIKVFTLRNADATALAEMLQNLFGQAQQAQQQAAGQVTATGAGESAIVPLRFSVDQRTNSIIASGNAGDLNVIYHILVRLDEGDTRKRETNVYRLRNAPAADVSNALTSMLQQQLALIQIAPELVTPIEQIDQQVIVVPEPVTNSIIVSATARRYAEINKMIETLDRRPPMVVIQVVIAEVTLQDNEAFGVEWGLQDALMFDRSSSATGNRFNFNSNPLTLPNDASATSLATATKVATQAVSNLALGRTDQALGFGGLALTASSESVSVLLRALEQSQRAQIISRPQVQTVDNQIAYVQVGARVPRIIGATTTTLGTVQPQVTDVPVGIILQVTPRVSLDGTVAMQLYAEKSSVGPDATGIPIAIDANGQAIRSPQIPITTAQTTVLARSGQTIILGGLITKDLEEQSRRIPYLADIPVLGRLFRFDTVSNKRTELLVIMTPFVVTSPEQIDWINAREGARMSWCLADIVNIHGPVPFGGNPMFNPSPTPLIYPDMQPAGLPGALPPGGLPPGAAAMGAVPPGPMPPGMLPGIGIPGPVLGGYPAGPAPYTTPTDSGPLPGTGVPGGYPPGPPPYAAPAEAIPPPLQPTPAAPYPAVPPATTPPPAATSPGSVIIPQPPSLLAPPPAGASGALSPSQVEPALPPFGTARAPAMMPPPYLPQMPPGQPPVAPAEFQQPAGR